ncbi:uncharacterized protein LOC125762144 isoform X1 [Anopheles funestus]|uniref:uncharacterized protein LOC125762144 isoform X1 n=1 Tax=Anopheles funestus TaxID=62324 RepID=UPI0020C5E087|nr:uncharacterized protein LOC125762144 isoform X1 [Anopheles funestus]
MATERRTDPAGSAQAVAHWHSLSGIRLLMLPIVLAWCSTFVHSAMEEMMIAPIEVIEEWGCYDTEIRLTCGNLESKIAILEARFTPRCMEQRTENCVYMDEHSIAHPFASQKVDKLILEETEAGRRFLATLRRNHERELEASDGPGTRELTADGVHRREGGTIVAARSLAKDKRSSLRATLEHLIVRYLRRLTSDDDADGDDGDEPGGYEVAARYRRQSLPATDSDSVSVTVPDASTASNPPATGFSNSMEITLLTNDTDTNLTESWEDEREQWGEDRVTSSQQLPDSSLTAGTGDVEPRAFASDAAAGYGSSGPLVAGLVGTREVTGDASVTSAVQGTSDDRGDSATGANGDSVLRDNGDEVEYNLPIGSAPSEAKETDGRMGELRQQRKQQKPKTPERHGECDSVRKRVSQLDRFELERSMRNGSFREYNIRNALNYRCSGKNHCSFIFSQDHPFAVVWKAGTVRIKYICMDDFRISKYCGEHLIVGNEVHWEPLDGDSDEDSTDGTDESYHPSYGTGTETAGSSGTSWRQQTPNEPTTDGIANGSANDVPASDEQPSARDPNDGGEDLLDESLVTLQERHYAAGSPYHRLARAGVGEPRAEALQAATVHSFHNLKILKPIDDDEEAMLEQHQQQKHPQQHHQQQQQQHNDTDMDRNQQEADAVTRSRNRQRQKVFSQDFRVLKILPSNLDVVEDIKQIGNEYYFKKDIEVVVDDRENEIVDSAGGRADGDKGQPVVNSTTTGDGDTTGSNMTETLDIVVLPAPTKDIEIYDNELIPDEAASSRPDDDISVIGLITPTRAAITSSMATASGEGLRISVSGSTPLPPTGAVSVDTTLGHWDVDRLDLPEPAEDTVQLSGENRTGFTVDESTPPFSFNNRTFQTMQETVRKEFDESQGPYPPLGGYDDGEEDDFEDEDDADEDDRGEQQQYGGGGKRRFGPNGRFDKSHKKHMSVQRTLLKHPLRQGFLMTPSYPKYYIGDSTCRWTLYAGVHQRIKLTVLDLALRYDDECRDYLQVVDLNTNQTLFHSCTESSRPIEIVSIQERLEVSVRTTTKVIYPKRGVLVHYTALGCELPSPTPGHMRLVRRTEHRVKYVCDPLHVFPDTGESVRELICTAKHTWNRPLPACIEKRATEGSGLVSHYEQKRRYGDSDNMSDKQADTVYDILIPSLIIAGLFVVNGIVFAVIMRYRNKRKQRLDLESKELAEL